jgi:hypothetical protein
MNTDYAYEMYRRILYTALDHIDFTASTSYRMKQIAEERHCGNGYFSWDGMLDDLTELLNDYDLASEILNKC